MMKLRVLQQRMDQDMSRKETTATPFSKGVVAVEE